MAEKKRRPILVWIITLFFFLANGFLLASLLIVSFHLVKLNPNQSAALASFSTWDWIFSAGYFVTGSAGMLAFFRLRRTAVPLLLLALGITLAAAAYRSVRAHGLDFSPGALIFQMATITYAIWLSRRKILI